MNLDRPVAALRRAAARLLHVAAVGSSERDERDDDSVLWRLVGEYSPVSMCLAGLDGTLRMANQAFAEMIGYTRAELREMTFEQITHPDDLARNLELREETLRGERSTYRLVKRYLHADGDVVWGDLSVALMRSEAGVPLYFISQVLDVTIQRLDLDRLAQAVEAAERERNLSRAILDTVDVGLLLVDRDGSYERVNRRQQDIFAMVYPDGGGLGGPVGHLYAADGLTQLTEQEMPVARAANGEEFDDERVWVGTDPTSRRALSVSSRTVRNAAGEFAGAALAFSDVTDLVHAVRAREVFATSVSHELRTPLTTVLGHLEILLEGGELPEAAVRQIRAVQRNAVRLRYLVSDLLDPAAQGPRAVTLSTAPTEVAHLIGEAVEAVRPAAIEAGVTLTDHAQGPIHAVLDADRVRQVLDNLITNAVKYTNTGDRVDVWLKAEQDAVAITVTDTGIGIAPEDVERLFDPFFRAGGARDRMSPGLGLGLGIAQSIVRAHGGQITVASTPEEGSSFQITLPLDVHPTDTEDRSPDQ